MKQDKHAAAIAALPKDITEGWYPTVGLLKDRGVNAENYEEFENLIMFFANNPLDETSAEYKETCDYCKSLVASRA